jgi:hypothetical protein
MSKAAAVPSAAWKILYTAAPEPILWLAHTGKGAPIQNKFKAFFNEWSQARNKIPYQLMQEMRITPDLPIYNELLEKLFFAIMDAKLETPEATRAFLEPYSPPAPPPPVNLRRRAVKREAKVPKSRAKKVVEAPTEVADATVGDAAMTAPAAAQKAAKAAAPSAKAPAAKAPPAKAVKTVPIKAPAKLEKTAAAKPVAKKAVAKAPAKKVAAKKPVKKAVTKPAKKAQAKKSAPAKKKPAPKPKAKTKGRR